MAALQLCSSGYPPFLPVLCLSAQTLALSLLIIYTSKGSPFRFAGLFCITLSGYAAFVSARSSAGCSSVVAAPSLVVWAHGINLLLLNPVDSHDKVSSQQEENTTNPTGPDLWISINVRGIGTRWQAKNTPTFPSFFNHVPPGRASFLLRQAAICQWQYLLLDVLSFAASQVSFEEKQQLYGPGTEFLYLDATREQWIARISSSLLYQFVLVRLVLDFPHRLASIVFVGIGLSSTADWPPMFNSMWDAYTLRNHWGKFWHQLLRWPFTSVSNYFTRRVLRLPQHSLVERYLNVLVVFTLSGLFHAVHDAGQRTPVFRSRAMVLLQSFVLGYMVEDGVQEIWRRLGIERGFPASRVLKKLVGYAWVATWFCVALPWYTYPLERIPVEKRQVVPFSVVDQVGVTPVVTAIGIGAPVLKFLFGAGL